MGFCHQQRFDVIVDQGVPRAELDQEPIALDTLDYRTHHIGSITFRFASCPKDQITLYLAHRGRQSDVSRVLGN